MTRRLILLRHGQTTYNATGRMQGQLDTELSEEGRRQARRAAEFFVRMKDSPELRISRILASDLTRARTTAEIIAAQLGLPVATDARLRETYLGEWQSRRTADVDVEQPGARAIWRHDATWAPPGGESRVEVGRRACPVIEELMESYEEWDGSAVLVVAHGGTISALTSRLLGWPVEHYPLLSGLRNTSWSQLAARPVFDPQNPNAPVSFREARAATGVMPEAQWYLDAWNAGVI
ncbi:histidine phosphatase family protein [Corynebacterium uropygiale]|uniref:Histidine phosphatase family protein n=1 Tax=Corynebacterium uropygiale TaxID=1775911 RepID=A0A9X1QQ29_9CORY|nr:histidine phosphatase family protein [Corynebacterium uropygiale]MCF4007542.1 histidine phosphatase family protein [Corynebacterium uropygiale]